MVEPAALVSRAARRLTEAGGKPQTQPTAAYDSDASYAALSSSIWGLALHNVPDNWTPGVPGRGTCLTRLVSCLFLGFPLQMQNVKTSAGLPSLLQEAINQFFRAQQESGAKLRLGTEASITSKHGGWQRRRAPLWAPGQAVGAARTTWEVCTWRASHTTTIYTGCSQNNPRMLPRQARGSPLSVPPLLKMHRMQICGSNAGLAVGLLLTSIPSELLPLH